MFPQVATICGKARMTLLIAPEGISLLHFVRFALLLQTSQLSQEKIVTVIVTTTHCFTRLTFSASRKN
jgi:hypothetical protein